jgi:hypothetical protein
MCICVSTDLTAVMCAVGYVSNMSLYRYGISKRAWPSNRPIPVSNSEIPPLFNLGVLHCVLISWNLPFLQLNCCLKDKPLSVSSTCIFHVPKWIHCFFVIAAHLVRIHFLKISISPLHSLQPNMSLEPSFQGIWVKCIHTQWIHMYYNSALNCLQVILYSWNAAWSIGLLQSCGQGLSLALVGINYFCGDLMGYYLSKTFPYNLKVRFAVFIYHHYWNCIRSHWETLWVANINWGINVFCKAFE